MGVLAIAVGVGVERRGCDASEGRPGFLSPAGVKAHNQGRCSGQILNETNNSCCNALSFWLAAGTFF